MAAQKMENLIRNIFYGFILVTKEINCAQQLLIFVKRQFISLFKQ